MKGRHRIVWILLLVLGITAGAGMGYWYAGRHGPFKPPVSVAAPVRTPVVRVTTKPIVHERIEEKLLTYGIVVAALGESRTISEPFETRVRRIYVTDGESVDAASPLIEIEPSPDSRLQLEKARSELDSAREAARLLQERIDLKLATKQELLVAQQRVQNAQLAFQSMIDRGMGASRVVKASASGLVMRIDAKQGEICPSGNSLLVMIGKRRINVRFGIECEDIGNIHVGQAVRIISVNHPNNVVDGKIRLITQQVNQRTRLVDVFVSPSGTAQLMLNEYVRGEIILVAEQGIVVPRAAVLPEGDHFILFTVRQDHAVKHVVSIGIENNNKLQLTGGDLAAGQHVVVSGNSELRDGIAVITEPTR